MVYKINGKSVKLIIPPHLRVIDWRWIAYKLTLWEG